MLNSLSIMLIYRTSENWSIIGRILEHCSVTLVPLDRFWQKNWSRTNFGSQKWSSLAKISPPRGTKFGKHIASYAVPMQN